MRLDSDRPAHPSPDTAPRSSTHPHRATRARSEENDPKWRGTCSVSNQSIYAIMHYGAALEPWPRQLDRKLDRNSTGTRQLDAQAHGASLDKPRAQARQELSTGARHRAGSTGKASTAPRQRASATFLTRPSNDKFQAGRHHPYMGEFERVNRFLFDRRMPFLHLVVSNRAPRSR